jgi:hypothetical protein
MRDPSAAAAPASNISLLLMLCFSLEIRMCLFPMFYDIYITVGGESSGERMYHKMFGKYKTGDRRKKQGNL